MTDHTETSADTSTDESTDRSADVTEAQAHVTEDAKAKFREALEAKKSGGRKGGGPGKAQGSLAGHANDGAHGHKVFRRKSG